MANKITTLKLTKETKTRLDNLKEHPRETYEDLLKKILWILNTIKKDPEKAKETLDQIDELRKRWAGKEKGKGKEISEKK